MNKFVLNYIRNNPLIYNYLREDSSWYKELINNPNSIYKLEEIAKKYYKQTPLDKMQKLIDNIELIITFIDVLK